MLESFLYEVDDDKIIKYKDKDGESQEMTAGAAKKMDKEHPAKIAWDKMDAKEKGGDDDDVKGKKLGKGDFDTTGGMGDKPSTGTSDFIPDDGGFPDDDDEDEPTERGDYDDVLGGYNDDDKLSDMTDDDEYENMQDEIIDIAAKKYNVDGDEISPDFKNSTDREEFNSGETFQDMIDMAEKFAKEEAERQGEYQDDARYRRTGELNYEPTHAEIMQHIEDEGYGGDAIGPDGNPTPEAYEDAKQELIFLKKQNETITINGKKYKAIKEEKTLKEQYDRLFTNRTVI